MGWLGIMDQVFEQNLKLIKQPNIVKAICDVQGQGSLREKSEPDNCVILLMLGADRITKWPKSLKCLVIYEPNIWQLRFFLEHVKLPLEVDITIVTSTNMEKVNQIFYQYLRSEARISAFASSGYVIKNSATEYDKSIYNQVLQKYISAGQQALTTFSGSPIHFAHGLRHFCYNASRKHIDYRSLKDNYKGIPAVLVSGGPSAEKDIPELTKFQGIISCVDCVYEGLLGKGVRVDFVGSMDREPKLIDYYKNVVCNSKLITIPEVSNHILDKFGSEVIMLPTLRKSYVKGLGWEDGYNGGTATTHLVYTYLRYLGCNPIILVGQDFGMTTDNVKSHQYSNLVQHPEHGASDFQKIDTTVQNSLGMYIRTCTSFLEMKSAYEEVIHGNPKDLITLNSSWGLDIIGTQRMELKEFNSKNTDIVLPQPFPNYRQMNLVNIDNVKIRLRKFRQILRDMLKWDNLNKMNDKLERLLASDLLYNDIVFVMLSSKYLEHQNVKTHFVEVQGNKPKKFFDRSRHFLGKIYKAVQILEKAVADENFVEVPPELDYTLD